VPFFTIDATANRRLREAAEQLGFLIVNSDISLHGGSDIP
jgi:hypothetical protein